MKTSPEKRQEIKKTLQRDKRLIHDSLKGNAESFAELMSLYYNRVTAIGHRFFFNAADKEDFAQEVFLKVFKNLSSFRGESSFATWITKIALTTALNSIKRTKDIEFDPETMEVPSNIYTPEEQQIRQLTMEAVKEAINDLPKKYAICLELYFFHDLNHEEISIITGFPVNTIKSHIFRAKKILRQKLKDFSTG